MLLLTLGLGASSASAGQSSKESAAAVESLPVSWIGLEAGPMVYLRTFSNPTPEFGDYAKNEALGFLFTLRLATIRWRHFYLSPLTGSFGLIIKPYTDRVTPQLMSFEPEFGYPIVWGRTGRHLVNLGVSTGFSVHELDHIRARGLAVPVSLVLRYIHLYDVGLGLGLNLKGKFSIPIGDPNVLGHLFSLSVDLSWQDRIRVARRSESQSSLLDVEWIGVELPAPAIIIFLYDRQFSGGYPYPDYGNVSVGPGLFLRVVTLKWRYVYWTLIEAGFGYPVEDGGDYRGLILYGGTNAGYSGIFGDRGQNQLKLGVGVGGGGAWIVTSERGPYMHDAVFFICPTIRYQYKFDGGWMVGATVRVLVDVTSPSSIDKMALAVLPSLDLAWGSFR